jgi:TonB-dependent receptor
MNTQRRIFLLLATSAALTGWPSLFAQGAATGSLSGHVTDAASQLALAGVRVSVPGTALETFTDARGDYILANVPAGAQSVEFDYVGYPGLKRSADVRAGRAVQLDSAFGNPGGVDVVQMKEFVIEGNVVGTARAVNQQRSAETLTNIVASDAIGQFPDQNAAESLQRVPGLALYRDQGEGRYIIIRGVNAQYNHVAVDGASLATPESGLRTAPLDVIGSDQLGAIEINKVNTPDMDADGLGGSVNLRSRSAFDAQTRQLMFNAETLYGNLRDTYGSKFNGTYGDVFADGKLGVLFSGSYQRRPYGSHNFEEGDGWSQVTSPTDGQQHYVFNDIAFREYEIVRTRESLNLNFDYRLSPATTLSLRTSYADFSDKENRWVTEIPFEKGTLTALTDSTASFTGVTAVAKKLRTREKEQKLTNAVLGFESNQGALSLDGQVSTSLGQEFKPNELEGVFNTKGTSSWSYAFDEPYHLTVVGTPGSIDPASPAAYVTAKSTLKNGRGKETEQGAKFNARYNFGEAALPMYVKAGVSYRGKEKELDKDSYALASNAAGYTFPALSEDGSQSKYPYFSGPRFSVDALRQLFYGNPASFTLTPKESLLEDFTAHEDVTGAYAMGGATLDRLNLTGGVRMEQTQFDTRGWQLRGTTYTPASASTNYTNWEPGIALRYNATKQTVLRASWSNTLSRPDFTQSAVSRTIDDTAASPSVIQGNVNLKPLKSVNWDASIEHYLPSLGVVSAAVFYKDIKDFSYQGPAGIDPITGYPLTTYLNGPKGHIAGLELAYQQQLRFLPAPFDGLGFMANVTFTDSSATFPTRPGENLAFIGQSKTIGNVALTYEKHGFFARLAANYRTPRLREDEPLGATAADDRYVDRFMQLDFTTSYRFNRSWEIYAEALNLTNEPFRVYFGNSSPKRLVQFEEYDWSANVGVRWKL